MSGLGLVVIFFSLYVFNEQEKNKKPLNNVANKE